MIETGIKTLDLFAPIAKGGTVGLVARPGIPVENSSNIKPK